MARYFALYAKGAPETLERGVLIGSPRFMSNRRGRGLYGYSNEGRRKIGAMEDQFGNVQRQSAVPEGQMTAEHDWSAFDSHFNGMGQHMPAPTHMTPPVARTAPTVAPIIPATHPAAQAAQAGVATVANSVAGQVTQPVVAPTQQPQDAYARSGVGHTADVQLPGVNPDGSARVRNVAVTPNAAMATRDLTGVDPRTLAPAERTAALRAAVGQPTTHATNELAPMGRPELAATEARYGAPAPGMVRSVEDAYASNRRQLPQPEAAWGQSPADRYAANRQNLPVPEGNGAVPYTGTPSGTVVTPVATNVADSAAQAAVRTAANAAANPVVPAPVAPPAVASAPAAPGPTVQINPINQGPQPGVAINPPAPANQWATPRGRGTPIGTGPVAPGASLPQAVAGVAGTVARAMTRTGNEPPANTWATPPHEEDAYRRRLAAVGQ